MASSKSDTSFSSWEAQIAQADALWEQGKLSEALAIYGLAIEENPKLSEIQQRLVERLKQQGDLAIAYEKLATGLKNQGDIEQAADYYRQAINIKALSGNTKEQLMRSSVFPTKTPIPLASLKEAAFSFQPLVKVNSAMVKVTSPTSSLPQITTKPQSISPSFPSRLKTVNPERAKDIDWETAQVYLQKALEHLEKQEWESSALACKQATEIMPNLAEAYKIWGNALQRMGNTGDAMSCYAKAVEIKPNLAEVYAGIADIYAQQNKQQQAIANYQKAIIIKPSAKIYRSLADVWLQLGNQEKAKFNLDRAKKLEWSEISTSSTKANLGSNSMALERSDIAHSIKVYCRQGQKLEQQKQWEQAAKCYRQALELGISRPALPAQVTQKKLPKSKISQQPVNHHSNKGVIKTSESQLDKAIKRYQKQSALQPNSPKIYTDLGNLYAKKGKQQQAIAYYRQSLKVNPRYAEAHLNLGRILLKAGNQQEFIQEMQLALALQPKIGTAIDRFYLANALADRGQQQQAINFYCKATVSNPRFIQSYHCLSAILSKQGKHQQAIEFLQQGITHNPQDPESYYFLGQQWEILQNWENAVKAYSKVLQIEPQFPKASQKLNHALAEKLRLNQKASSSSSM
ncbi:tetratricopeptide repeat protein [Pleurocapsales cyanobacterium LEGE 10410]|nr:tetratricopeptide repeat protein [Pleurocapsales cyanobacterium LEGE 10410]